LGHRLSVDADFFSNSPFNTQVAEEKLYQVLPGFSLLKMSPHGIAGFYHNVKIDLYTWHVPFLLPPIEEEGMRMAALPDIAALKLEAVVNRKEEKDFRDIHALLSVFSLVELLEFYHARVAGRDPRLVLDHLSAAPAVDRSEPVTLLKNTSYEQVSEDLLNAIRNHIALVKMEKERQAEDRLRERLKYLKKQNEDENQ
jgi:hypothetical protein